MELRCHLCHEKREASVEWWFGAHVTINPWRQQGQWFNRSPRWHPYREDYLCPVCWWRLSRAMDGCYGGIFNIRSKLLGWLLESVLMRWPCFRRWLPPALLEEAQVRSRSCSGSQAYSEPPAMGSLD